MSTIKTKSQEIQISKQNIGGDSSADLLNRSNQAWLEMMSGKRGDLAQRQAHEALSNYLYIVVQNYLVRRQSEFLWFATLTRSEIAATAEDLVQLCLEKLSRNDFAVLGQFKGKGSFTGWAAQIVLNEARSDLRRVHWSRIQPLDKSTFKIAANMPDPVQILQKEEGIATLYKCLGQLSEIYRSVLIRCVVNGERAEDVARDIKRSTQAVYNLVDRAKKRLALLLRMENLGPEDLTVFSD